MWRLALRGMEGNLDELIPEFERLKRKNHTVGRSVEEFDY